MARETIAISRRYDGSNDDGKQIPTTDTAEAGVQFRPNYESGIGRNAVGRYRRQRRHACR